MLTCKLLFTLKLRPEEWLKQKYYLQLSLLFSTSREGSKQYAFILLNKDHITIVASLPEKRDEIISSFYHFMPHYSGAVHVHDITISLCEEYCIFSNDMNNLVKCFLTFFLCVDINEFKLIPRTVCLNSNLLSLFSQFLSQINWI